MEWTGKLIKKLGMREGVSKNGPWKIGVYLLEEQSMYPKKLMVEVSDGLSARVAQWDAMMGKDVVIQFDIDAREYKEQWYNTLRAYSIKEKP